jgi:predicted dehydrogenase
LAGEVTRAEGWPGPDANTHSARLRLACGANAWLQATDAAACSMFEMDLVGSRGRIRISESGHRIERWTLGKSPFYSGYQAWRALAPVGGGMRDVTLHAVEDLVRCVATGAAPRCSGQDGVEALRIGEAVVRTAERRRGQRAKR